MRRIIRALLPLMMCLGALLASACGMSNTATTPSTPTTAPSAQTQCTLTGPHTEIPPGTPIAASGTDPLAALSDDFSQPDTLAQWQDLEALDGFPTKTERLDSNTTHPGELYVVPYTSTWFEDNRAVFLFKPVMGDFTVTTRIMASGKGSTVPTANYSLSGLTARAPRSANAAHWSGGGENWLFIATGIGDTPRSGPVTDLNAQLETKTTVNSASDLRLTPSQPGWVNLRITRVGPYFLMQYRFSDAAPWLISRCFYRPDLPQQLQVGLNAYTDYASLQTLYPNVDEANRATVRGTGTHPDLLVRDDYIHFQTTRIPPELVAGASAGTLPFADLLRIAGGQ